MREKDRGASLPFEPLPCFLKHTTVRNVCIVQRIDPSVYRLEQGGETAL